MPVDHMIRNRLLIILLLLVAVIMPVTIYLACRLMRTEYASLWDKDTLIDMLQERVAAKYRLAAMISLGTGFFIGSLGTFSWTFLDIAFGLIAGWPIGSLWGQRDGHDVKIANEDIDPSVPGYQLSASDSAQRPYYEGRIEALPMWKDMSVMIAIQVIGTFIGFLALSIWHHVSK